MKRLIIELLLCVGLGAWLLIRLNNHMDDMELIIFLVISVYFMVLIVKLVIKYIEKNVKLKSRK